MKSSPCSKISSDRHFWQSFPAKQHILNQTANVKLSCSHFCSLQVMVEVPEWGMYQNLLCLIPSFMFCGKENFQFPWLSIWNFSWKSLKIRENATLSDIKMYLYSFDCINWLCNISFHFFSKSIEYIILSQYACMFCSHKYSLNRIFNHVFYVQFSGSAAVIHYICRCGDFSTMLDYIRGLQK